MEKIGSLSFIYYFKDKKNKEVEYHYQATTDQIENFVIDAFETSSQDERAVRHFMLMADLYDFIYEEYYELIEKYLERDAYARFVQTNLYWGD